MVIPLSAKPKGLLVASALCMAISGITDSWATDELPDGNEPAEELSADEIAALTTMVPTPAHYLFSSGTIENTENGPVLNLKVPEGVPGDMSGLIQAVDEGDGNITLSLEGESGEGFVETQNSTGAYGQLHVRRVKISIQEFANGAGPGSEDNPIFQDDIYNTIQYLINSMSQKQDFRSKDVLLHANKSLVIIRPNGDISIELYRQNNEDKFEYLGHLESDKEYRYQLTPSADNPEFYQEREKLHMELKRLTAEITELRNLIVSAKDTSEMPARMKQFEELTKQLRTLYREIDPPEEFHYFAVTESINYAATNWLKAPDNAGMEIAAQSIAFTTMGNIHKLQLAKASSIQALNEAQGHALEQLEELHNELYKHSWFNGATKTTETGLSFLFRKLNTAYAYFYGGKGPLFHGSESLGTEYTTFNGQVTQAVDGVNALDTLGNAQTLLSNTRLNTDRVMIWDDQFDYLEASLEKSSRWAWAKSFFRSGAYDSTDVSKSLRSTMEKRGASQLSDIFVKANANGGIPYLQDGELKLAGSCCSNPAFPKDVYAKFNSTKEIPTLVTSPDGQSSQFTEYKNFDTLTDDQKKSLLTLRQNEAHGKAALHVTSETKKKLEAQESLEGTGVHPVSAFLTSAAIGYTLQYGADGFGKMYNEGKMPWNYKSDDWDEMNSKAQKTALLSGISGAVHNYVLPKVAKSYSTFENMTPSQLQGAGLKNNYTAVGAGAIAGFTSHTLSAGYNYWQGKMTPKELALDVTDAAVRAIPSAVGSAVGHYVMPTDVHIPLLSSLVPIGGFLGSVAGNVAANMAYDTAKHYAFSGAKKVGFRFGSTQSSNNSKSLLVADAESDIEVDVEFDVEFDVLPELDNPLSEAELQPELVEPQTEG